MSTAEFSASVVARYLPEQSDPSAQAYAFAYTVTVRNTGDVTGQLIAREWLIQDGAGERQQVRGLGVVGQQPVLKPGEQFEYTSWTRIATPSGTMRGRFFCMTDEADPFETPVAPFELSLGVALH